MFKKIASVALIASILMNTACRYKQNSDGIGSTNLDARDGEKFSEFYDKFLADSVFQMTRIQFPLEGRPRFVDTLNHKDEFYFTEDVWVKHKPTDYKAHPEFKRQFKDVGFMLQEIIEFPKDLFIERRWRQIDGKWFLVFYGDINNRNLDAVTK